MTKPTEFDAAYINGILSSSKLQNWEYFETIEKEILDILGNPNERLVQANRLRVIVKELDLIVSARKGERKDQQAVVTVIMNIKKEMKTHAERDRFAKYLAE